MSMEKMREQFEAWTTQHFNFDESVAVLERSETGDGYRLYAVDCAWIGWQASRAALVIELRAPQSFVSPDGWNEFDAAKDAIEDAGVTVKVKP